MVMETKTNISPGMPVYSLDGEAIGTIKEVRDDFFKVDVPHRRDFWLLREYLLDGEGNEAQLVLPKKTVRRYKLRKPERPEFDPEGRGPGSHEPGISDHDMFIGR
jgi:hypothetical protein